MINPPTPFPLVPTIPAGSGRIALRAQGRTAAFSELSAAYPLKLLSPRTTQDKVAVVYVLTYGGGLVGGDQLKLCVNVEDEAVLVLLSQVSRRHSDSHVNFSDSNRRGPQKYSRLDQDNALRMCLVLKVLQQSLYSPKSRPKYSVSM